MLARGRFAATCSRTQNVDRVANQQPDALQKQQRGVERQPRAGLRIIRAPPAVGVGSASVRVAMTTRAVWVLKLVRGTETIAQVAALAQAR